MHRIDIVEVNGNPMEVFGSPSEKPIGFAI